MAKEGPKRILCYKDSTISTGKPRLAAAPSGKPGNDLLAS